MKISSQRFGTFSFPSDFSILHTATLNKADLRGGNNKFYHIEAHVSKDGTCFRLYSRYGRVGSNGVEEERIPPQNEVDLVSAFNALKKAKTSKRKGYVEVMLAASKMGSSIGNQQIISNDIRQEKLDKGGNGKAKKLDLKLDPSVETLVTRLYKEAGQAVRSQLSGTLKATAENPLGTLTLSQIDGGRLILQEIQKLLASKPKMQGGIHGDLLDLSNRFYSAIPQTIPKRPRPTAGKTKMDAWLKTMALNDADKLDEKEDLLELLSDVKGMVGGFATSDVAKKYLEIGCEYEPVERGGREFRNLSKFMSSTRSKHHSWDSRIVNIWKMSVGGQRKQHLPSMKKVGNITPLFHGSRGSNILGICKRGLLLRPPGVYITGSMFGNGLYFADSSSKSEQYSTARFGGSSGGGTTYFMFVADVALGTIKKYQNAQTSLTKPPRGFHSVQGAKGFSLLHNEFIIYSIEQHLLQYLVEFKPSGRYW